MALPSLLPVRQVAWQPLAAVRRTEWVPLALFYYDAEVQLGRLCPQRRRWINGTYAAYLTVAARLDVVETDLKAAWTLKDCCAPAPRKKNT